MTSDKHQTMENPTAVLTKATLRVAERLNLDDASLARIIGASVVEVVGCRRGDRAIAPLSPEGGQAVLLIRVFRALDALVGGNATQCLTWMTSDNTALGGVPAQLIQQPGGLVTALAYLEDHTGGTLSSRSDAANL